MSWFKAPPKELPRPLALVRKRPEVRTCQDRGSGRYKVLEAISCGKPQPSRRKTQRQRAGTAPPPESSMPLPEGARYLGRCRVLLADGRRAAWPYLFEDLQVHEGDLSQEFLLVELVGPSGEISWLEDGSVECVGLPGGREPVDVQVVRSRILALNVPGHPLVKKLSSAVTARCQPLAGSPLLVTAVRIAELSPPAAA